MKKLFTGKVLLITVLLAVIFVFLGSKWIKSKKANQLESLPVKKGNLSQIVSAAGEIKAEEQVDLKFQTSGLMTWVGVKEGDYVKKWQAIAQLDRRELQKNLEKYLRDYSEQRNDFEEMYRVTYKGAKPEEALTDTAKRILEKNQWDLEKAVLDVELKDIALKLATLVTPIEGLVTHIDMPVAGVNITPATAVFTVTNPSKLIFMANIDEVDIGQVKTDQKTKITLDAFPDEILEVTVVQVEFTPTTTSGGGTAYAVKFNLPVNLNEKYRLGMNGDAEIVIESKEQVLLVPNQTIKETEEQKFVWLLENKTPIKKEIKTGLSNETETEVLEGLKEGDQVIINKK